MKKIVLLILMILTLNSCFLAITGAPHNHSYKEINGYNDLYVHVHCSYLIKNFQIINGDPKDSLYIKSSSFKNPTEKKSLNGGTRIDSIRFYQWRISDTKYHKNILKDTIEITKITKEKNEKVYKFVAVSTNKKH